jgi:biopolymer transport protein ExbB/TolQ
MLHEIFALFRAREPIPFLILALVAVGWVIIFERFILLQFLYRVNFRKFNQTIKTMLAAGDTERARTFCLATSKTGLPHITFKAIEAFEKENFKVRMVVSEEALSFLPRVRRRISQLPTFAACAVLLGALAAVHGVWQSFQVADGLELGLKSFAFTKGLSGALTPLALSLLASVLLMLPYGLLDAIAGRLEGEIEHSLTLVLNILAPEMQPVFAAAPAMAMAGAGAAAASAATAASGSNKQSADASDDEPALTSRGGYEEPDASDRIESVPDEEEII